MRIFAALTASFILLTTSCSTPTRPETAPTPDGLNVVLVVARELRSGYGPLGVGDRFPLEGRMVGYASLTWSDVNLVWGQPIFEWRWYSADRLIKRSQAGAKIGKPPHYVWNITQPIALGVGKGHVEFLLNDRVLATRAFEVVDTASTPVPAPAKDSRT